MFFLIKKLDMDITLMSKSFLMNLIICYKMSRNFLFITIHL